MNSYVYWGTVAVVILILLALADYPFIGQILIGLFALLAFWRFESSQVFKLALIALAVMLAMVVTNWWQAVSAFAAYAFLLFMVGVFVLGHELWRFSKDLRKQREEDSA